MVLLKLVYLSMRRLSTKWNQPIPNWGLTAQQLVIKFWKICITQEKFSFTLSPTLNFSVEAAACAAILALRSNWLPVFGTAGFGSPVAPVGRAIRLAVVAVLEDPAVAAADTDDVPDDVDRLEDGRGN